MLTILWEPSHQHADLTWVMTEVGMTLNPKLGGQGHGGDASPWQQLLQ